MGALRAVARARTVAVLLILASCGGSAPPDGSATSEGAMRISYGDDQAQYGDLHLPAGDGPHPTIVLIHGGFWLARYDAGLMTELAEDLVGRGYAVWNIEYRRVGNGGGWPATLADAADATDHLADLATEHALDLDRLLAVGHSAGGQLAVWLAARPGLPDGAPGSGPRVVPAGVVSQAGVLALREAAEQRLGGGSTQRFLGGTPEEVPDRYDLASPVSRLPIGAPSVAVHGADDQVVPPSQSETFVAAARQSGDDAELVLIDGEGHFAHLDPGSQVWAAAVGALEELMP